MRIVVSRLVVAALVAASLGLAGCAGRPVPAAPADARSVRTVRAALLNVLTCPSVNCSVVEDLHAGEKVSLLSPEINGWHQVRVLKDGQEGYVQARFLGR
ncbi:SH3 type 3 domain protein [Solidesulfovibrio fructosivorans JJ]]|uniref:SH3 type 3 domain protein n=1 Tax=Solidesulfovibrio fructosivorans JJ] TaxID=596151 RepID=E1JVQ3_SOLFR|nr:SH3 domain-containing protein [Solidesulfovibrio fructosivorans]EFL51541.1 SH3 type 3 domain protein [Solidesulfovibrio fructosivorans JJ]]